MKKISSINRRNLESIRALLDKTIIFIPLPSKEMLIPVFQSRRRNFRVFEEDKRVLAFILFQRMRKGIYQIPFCYFEKIDYLEELIERTLDSKTVTVKVPDFSEGSCNLSRERIFYYGECAI